jgi:hypothetical protein
MPAEGPFYRILFRFCSFLEHFVRQRSARRAHILSSASPRVYTSRGLCLSIYHGFSTLSEHIVCQRSAQQAGSIDFSIVSMFSGEPRRSGWQARSVCFFILFAIISMPELCPTGLLNRFVHILVIPCMKTEPKIHLYQFVSRSPEAGLGHYTLENETSTKAFFYEISV